MKAFWSSQHSGLWFMVCGSCRFYSVSILCHMCGSRALRMLGQWELCTHHSTRRRDFSLFACDTRVTNGQVLTRPEQAKCYQEGSFQLTGKSHSSRKSDSVIGPEDKVHLTELTEVPQPCVRLQVERNQPVLDPQERS